MTYKETLEQVRALLTPESCWTQEMSARDINGDERSPNDDDAVSWCLLGAVEKINDEDYGTIEHNLKAVLGSAVSWNDDPERTHQEVLDMLDKQIATC